MKIEVFKIPQNAPDDLSGFQHLIEQKTIAPEEIVAVIGKTEGNGCVDDFTRGFAIATLKTYLNSCMSEALTAQIVFVMSGGTEGVLSPHLTVFTRQTEGLTGPMQMGLALGVFP